MVKVGVDGKIRAFFKDKVVMWISSCKKEENLFASFRKRPENQQRFLKYSVKKLNPQKKKNNNK